MKKGFTLIELLAVITLIGLLSLIVIPVVDKLIKDNKNKLYEIQITNIENGAKNWASEHIFELPESGYIDKTICDLEFAGFLELDIKNPKTDELFYKDSYVRITKTDYGYEYKYVEGGNLTTCDVCVAVTESTKTTGNIPIGEYNPGDEYICEVAPEKKYHFFVVSEEVEKVNLLMDSNVDLDGKPIKEIRGIDEEYKNYLRNWISKEDYVAAGGTETEYGTKGNNNKGPLTIINYLNQATKSWININTRTFIYSDINGKYSLTINNNTRLPNVTELESSGCQIHTNKDDNSDLATCPLWAINYLGGPGHHYDNYRPDSNCTCGGTCSTTNIFNKYACRTEVYATGYALMDTVYGYNDRAYSLGYAGDIDGDTDVTINKLKGIRPVISISKSLISG